MKQAVLYLLILLYAPGFSQQLERVVADARSRQPLDLVSVTSEDKKIHLMSNRQGKILLFMDKKLSHYFFYRMGYERLKLSAGQLQSLDTIFLHPKDILLQEVSVSPKVLDTIVQDKRFYVNDFVVLPDNNFLLLTSGIGSRGFTMHYYSRDKGILQSRKFAKEEGECFFIDCFRNIHLLTSACSRQIFFTSESSFDLLPKYSRERFDSTLAIAVLNLDSAVIIKKTRPKILLEGEYFDSYMHSPFLLYQKVNKSGKDLFYTAVYNKETREMIKNEIRDTERIAVTLAGAGGRVMSQQASESCRDLFFSKVAAPIYAPAFLKNDTVIIFNFQEFKIVFLSPTAQVLKEIPIQHDNWSTLRNFEVIQDPVKNSFYIRSQDFDGGALHPVDIYNGKVGRRLKLARPYVYKIQVYNQRAYYLVKEKQWDDTMYLYEQKL